MGCVSFKTVDATAECFFRPSLAHFGTTATTDIKPLIALPHQVLAGQNIKTDDALSIPDISDKVPTIIQWLNFCDTLSLLTKREKESLANPSHTIDDFTLTDSLTKTTFRRLNTLISERWESEKSDMRKNGISLTDFSESDIRTSVGLRLEFETNHEYGGNDELGLRLVDLSSNTVMFFNTERYSEPLREYLNKVIELLCNMSGQGIGECAIAEGYYFGEVGCEVAELSQTQREQISQIITTMQIDYDDDMDDSPKKLAQEKAIVCAINSIADGLLNTQYMDCLEDEIANIEQAIAFSNVTNHIRYSLDKSLQQVKKRANEQVRGRNKREKKILKLLNTLTDHVIDENTATNNPQSFDGGSDAYMFDAHHCYLSDESKISEVIESHFNYLNETGEVPAFLLDLGTPNRVIDDLIDFQKGMFCTVLLEHTLYLLDTK